MKKMISALFALLLCLALAGCGGNNESVPEATATAAPEATEAVSAPASLVDTYWVAHAYRQDDAQDAVSVDETGNGLVLVFRSESFSLIDIDGVQLMDIMYEYDGSAVTVTGLEPDEIRIVLNGDEMAVTSGRGSTWYLGMADLDTAQAYITRLLDGVGEFSLTE